MDEKLNALVAKYVSPMRLDRQAEIRRHLAEMMMDHAAREAQLEIALEDELSSRFLDAILESKLWKSR